MARPQNQSNPLPSNEGGYEFEVITVGPPEYFTLPSEARARGKLIPAGEGDELLHRPAPSQETESDQTISEELSRAVAELFQRDPSPEIFRIQKLVDNLIEQLQKRTG
jgi:hypothetical protein